MATRRSWQSLSSKTRQRYTGALKRQGISNPQRYYETGGDLSIARGHGSARAKHGVSEYQNRRAKTLARYGLTPTQLTKARKLHAAINAKADEPIPFAYVVESARLTSGKETIVMLQGKDDNIDTFISGDTETARHWWARNRDKYTIPKQVPEQMFWYHGH